MDINTISIDSFDWLPHLHTKMWRWDNLHPIISGNKWFKLLGYEEDILSNQSFQSVITFGGPHSNHLHACAEWCNLHKKQLIAIVRGEEYSVEETSTLQFLKASGAILYPVTRTDYKEKFDSSVIKQIISTHADPYVIPEGGEGSKGEYGFHVLHDQIPKDITHICLSVGTGTTLKGLRQIIPSQIPVFGFSSFKKMDNQFSFDYLRDNNVHLFDCTKWGKFGAKNDEVIHFMNDFFQKTTIKLDMVYTAKMMLKIRELYTQNVITSSDRLLIIHTGGLQGNDSVRSRLLW